MLTGRNPLSGEPLGLKSAPGREPVPGFDLTFSAPKSVSVTWALGGHPVSGVLAEAHRAAVAEALAYLERQACWVRRGKGGSEFLQGVGFLGAAYVHRSSRAGDPQLHTHVLIANATLGPDGRWSRLYHPAIYEHATTASYLYQAQLRHELSLRLGAEWEQVVNGIAELRGFTPEQLRHFSTRRAEIVEAAGPGASAREMQIATLQTRRAKQRDLTDESLREAWRVKGAEVGLTRESVCLTLGKERPGETVLTARAIERALTHSRSHFDRRDAIRAVADQLPHGAKVREVEKLADAYLRSDSVIRIAESPCGARYTSERIWELEQAALAKAQAMAGQSDRCLVHPIIARRATDERPSLKADQREMVGRLLSGGRGLEVVIGEAGTGKTYATVAAASGWQAAGMRVLVAAPTWRAANVLRAEGLEAVSVARLLRRLDGATEGGGRAMDSRTVLLVDEAGMVDSGTWARLIDHAHGAQAKVVAIGDPAQLGEIEAGGLFAAVAGRTEPIRLDEVIRHHHDLDREAAKLIRDGRGTEAIDRYAEAGRLLVPTDAVERREGMVQDWAAAHARGEDALMIAKLNSERARLNERAREVLKTKRKLGEREIEVGGRRFAAGDEVITRVNDQRAQVFNRERWRVEEVDPSSGRMRLAGIDTPGRQVGVDPGYLGRVNPSDGAPAVEHAYAVTIYQAQGATVDSAFVLADPSMSRQEFYVAASRSRGETYLYATPETRVDRAEIAPHDPPAGLEHIARAAERDGSQSAAHDAALRSELGKLSTPELYARRDAAAREGFAEGQVERSRQHLGEDAASNRGTFDQIERARRELGPEPGLFSKRAERQAYERRLDEIGRWEERAVEKAEGLKAELRGLPDVSHQARAEAAVAEHLIAERMRARITAVRVDPPRYILRELGERPSAGREREAWDRGALTIESYRAKHGIGDRDNALGPEHEAGRPRGSGERSRDHDREHARRALLESQRRLGRVKEQARERDLGRGLEIGF